MPRNLAEMLQVALPTGSSPTTRTARRRTSGKRRSATRSCFKEPVGVVGAITPWNFPLYQIALKVAPALAAGCTVVLKPSEVAPINAFILAEIIHEAGLPKGVFNLVTGLGPVVGEAIAEPPARRQGFVHRLDPRGQAGHGALRRSREARLTRDGRQVREHHPARTRTSRRPSRPASSPAT